jgi:hypothetical protein
LCACAPEAADRTTAVQKKRTLVPEGLVLLPDAKDIQRADNYDGLLKYRLNEPFPADTAIKTLDKNLAESGWIPVSKDLFNPGGQTSLRTWSIVESDKTVHTWTGYWQDKGENLLQINLRYLVRRHEGELLATPPAELQIIAFSQAAVAVLKKQFK